LAAALHDGAAGLHDGVRGVLIPGKEAGTANREHLADAHEDDGRLGLDLAVLLGPKRLELLHLLLGGGLL
jgi:hypothetical protein